ncbi:MAG TPA: hypothetical protein VJ777_26705, partial [Mycobacterium sp.]|nr:hypothetical protein [Mycobacterium sp.]
MNPLPEPRSWHDRNVTVALGVLLFGASGVIAAAWTVGALARGDFITAAITAGGTMFTLSTCAGVLVTRFKHVALRGSADQKGTVLRPDPLGTALTCITFAAVIPSGALYVIYVPEGVVDLPLSRGEQIFTPILIGFLVALAVGGLIAYARRGPGYLLLSPQGFEIRELVSTKRGSWSEVTDITDNAPGVKARHPIVILTKDSQPQSIQGASGYAPNGAALYWMIRHYWKHPENR